MNQCGEVEIGCGVMLLGLAVCVIGGILGMTYLLGPADLLGILKALLPLGECVKP